MATRSRSCNATAATPETGERPLLWEEAVRLIDKRFKVSRRDMLRSSAAAAAAASVAPAATIGGKAFAAAPAAMS
ncbi:MAG: twin-arginine translocation signal domain-containing protein, partial [Parvibaculaceae bacterium]